MDMPQTLEQPVAITSLLQQLMTNKEFMCQENMPSSFQLTTSSTPLTSNILKNPQVVFIDSNSDKESDSTCIPTQDKGKAWALNIPSPEHIETQLPLFLDSPTPSIPANTQTSTALLTHSFINIDTFPLEYN